MTVDATDIVTFLLLDLVVATAVSSFWTRRLVKKDAKHVAKETVRDEILPSVKAELQLVLTQADERVAIAKAEVSKQLEELQADQDDVDPVEQFREDFLPLIEQKLQVVLQQADARIAAGKAELEAALAQAQAQQLAHAQAVQDIESPGKALGRASVLAREETAMLEEVFEAALTKAVGLDSAPAIIGTAKAIMPKIWKNYVKKGPDAVPGLLKMLERVSPIPLTNGHVNAAQRY